jgi:hypothetical protein
MSIRRSQRHGGKSGRVLRPKATVLKPSALIPADNLIKPPPTRFTHELIQSQPYYYKRGSSEPDGTFAAGTRVLLLEHDGGEYCRVADAQGLCVETACLGLRPLDVRKTKTQARSKK